MKNTLGLIALSPLLVFVVVNTATALMVGDFYKVPISVVFLVSCIFAVLVVGKGKTPDRIKTFSKGAGSTNILLMIWIFAMAGTFTATAKAMGSVDTTVNLILSLLPANMLLPGLFVTACLVSFSIGTSVGTIVALVPIASGLAQSCDIHTPLMIASVVGGAFFGDNLSFISDTTVVATTTQGCSMRDKFKVNAFITMPAAIITLVLYLIVGHSQSVHLHELPSINPWAVLPYLVVILGAFVGMHVLSVLSVGLLTAAAIGLANGSFSVLSLMTTMSLGMLNMGELILVSLMAGGLLELIKQAGGVDFIIEKLSRKLSGKRSAEFSIGVLVSLVDACTANNTIAILTVADTAKHIAKTFNVDPRKTASILDTFSCCMQGLLPYGAQLLMAAGLAAISPMEIIPYLYYTFILIISVCGAIILRYPRRYS